MRENGFLISVSFLWEKKREFLVVVKTRVAIKQDVKILLWKRNAFGLFGLLLTRLKTNKKHGAVGTTLVFFFLQKGIDF